MSVDRLSQYRRLGVIIEAPFGHDVMLFHALVNVSNEVSKLVCIVGPVWLLIMIHVIVPVEVAVVPLKRIDMGHAGRACLFEVSFEVVKAVIRLLIDAVIVMSQLSYSIVI
jgi:hypothetical protein